MSWFTSIRNAVENIGSGTAFLPGASLTGRSAVANLEGAKTSLVGGGGAGSSSSVDPFGQYRGNYINMLNGLMTAQGGQNLTSSPGKATAAQMQSEAIQRQANATGQGNSGNLLYSLTQAGANMGNQTYQQQYSLLQALSGANQFNPSGIASIQAQQSQMQGQTAQQGISLLTSLL